MNHFRQFVSKNLGVLLVVPAFALLMGISIYPLIYCAVLSVEDWNFLKAYIPPSFVGVANYVELFKDPAFANTLQVSILFAFATVSIELALGILIGMLFSSERLRFAGLLRSLMLLPMVVTPVIVGLTWKTLLNQKWGIVNYFLSQIGVEGIQWYTSPTEALPTMVLIDVWQWTPFVALVVFAALLSMPREPFEAAAIDGASRVQVFRHVTLPMLRGAIALAVLIRLIDALREFDKIYVLTRGGPGQHTDVLSIFGYRTAFFHGYVSYASAISFVLFVIIIVLCTVLLTRVLAKKEK